VINCGICVHAGGGSSGGEEQSGGTPAGGTVSFAPPAPGGGGAGGGGFASAGAPAPGGGFGGVASATDNIGPLGNAPPALNPAAHPPAAGMAAIFDAWAEITNVQASEHLRADLTAGIDLDGGELLAWYIG